MIKNKLYFLYISFFFSFIVSSQSAQEDLARLLEANSDLLEEQKNLESLQILGNDKSIDTNVVVTEVLNPEKSNIFGFDYIKSIPTSISATSDLPVPNDYVISLGDKLKIFLTGGKKDIFTTEVGLDGSIIFPELGAVNVFGETIDEVRIKIKKLVDLSYVGTDVNVSLETLAAKKINVIGAVKNPGTYIVSPFTTITSALAYSGGFEDYASVRDIKLIRNGSESSFDLYDLLIFGQRESDLNLQQGDTILINSTNNFIDIKGSVNRPFTYQYKNNETLNDLINFSMGLTMSANPNKIAIIDYDQGLGTRKINEVNIESNIIISSFNSPISIEIFNIVSSPSLQVRVFGPLENQGYFDLPDSRNLKELLESIVFTSEIYPFLGVVQEGNLTRLFSVIDESTHDIELKDNYQIIFFSKFEDILSNSIITDSTVRLIDEYKLRVFTKTSELSFPFFGSLSANDVIDFFDFDVSDFEENKTTYVAPLKDFVQTTSFNDIKFTASKFNSLSFRSFADQTIKVNVSGEVKLPGNYILDSSTNLKEFYDLFGGITKTADENTVVFKRISVRDQNVKALETSKDQLREFILTNTQDGNNINPEILAFANIAIDDENIGRISGDFSYDSENLRNTFLQDGDSVFIPKRLNTVSVIGEVLNPTTFIYDDGIDLREAIDLSGGYKQYALKRSTYVIRANGLIEKSSGGVFSRNIKILPGDTIVVPRDLDIRDDWQTTLVPITSLLSNLAFSAAALESIQQE